MTATAAKGRSLLDWDRDLTGRLAVCSSRDSRFGSMRPVMRWLEHSCNGIVWLVFAGAAVLVAHQIELHEKLLNLISALFVDIALVGLCKALVRRKRPFQNNNDMMTISVDKYSFPSGHASRAVMVACFILAHFSLDVVFQIAIVAWSVCICASRILLGRHHVIDVIFGVFLGFVEYRLLVSFLWMPRDLCESLIRPIQEELHL